MNFVMKYRLIFAGIVFGALAGFLYWKFVGCSSGTCAITSNPLNSTLYGAMLGGLAFDLFRKNEQKSSE
ncbi:MAG: hypothetical protein KIS94_01050 [Chitinophagales bacterium]|nr:hypothetical protein [Chitinophagales bacterium]